jgi:hypothetical protein
MTETGRATPRGRSDAYIANQSLETLPEPLHLQQRWSLRPSPRQCGHADPSARRPVPPHGLHSTSTCPRPPQFGHVPWYDIAFLLGLVCPLPPCSCRLRRLALESSEDCLHELDESCPQSGADAAPDPPRDGALMRAARPNHLLARGSHLRVVGIDLDATIERGDGLADPARLCKCRPTYRPDHRIGCIETGCSIKCLQRVLMLLIHGKSEPERAHGPRGVRRHLGDALACTQPLAKAIHRQECRPFVDQGIDECVVAHEGLIKCRNRRGVVLLASEHDSLDVECPWIGGFEGQHLFHNSSRLLLGDVALHPLDGVPVHPEDVCQVSLTLVQPLGSLPLHLGDAELVGGVLALAHRADLRTYELTRDASNSLM